jgi:hypothetical protein
VRLTMVAAVTAKEREETGRRMLERVTVHSKRVLGECKLHVETRVWRRVH